MSCHYVSYVCTTHCTTVNKMICASGMKSTMMVAQSIACGARVTWEVVKRAGVKYVILGDTRGWALGAEGWVE